MMRVDELRAALAVPPGDDTGAGVVFDRVETDSRTLAPGALFVALRGDNFDGHDFVAAAAERGAAAALVDRAWFMGQSRESLMLPVVAVDDTRIALGQLAGCWRVRFRIPLIGVTGSNGKTTVKEMCAAILRAQAAREGASAEDVLATGGNFNNDIGLPLTLCRLRAHHRAAVIEMGMNHPGEIAYLTHIARPTVAVVNNAQRAHLEGMGSVQQVAEEKGTIYAGLGDDGIAVINADDPHADYWRGLNTGRNCVVFGMHGDADVCGDFRSHGLGGVLEIRTATESVEVSLRVAGQHNAANALNAAACCLAAGATLADVSAGLAGFEGVKGRLQRVAGPHGALILDDTYNANPDSVRAGIDVLASTPGHTVLVLGDMGEVGETSAQVHDEIGGYAKSKGVDGLFALGEMSTVAVRNFGEGAHHFRTPETLVAALVRQLGADTVVLVKGSRFMRMERVVNLLAAVHNSAPSINGGSHAA